MTGHRHVRVHGCTIEAVPSVHFRLPFAQAVNVACADAGRAPHAIAVELPEQTVAEVRAWFQELGVGPAANAQVPCMLALIGQAGSPRAGDADEGAGGVRTLRWLPLSPLDSIVEAIRCGLELGVPVVGVDANLEAAEFTRPEPGLFPDPLEALDGLGRYAAVAGAFVEPQGCPADRYRERVMASRLLRLAASHARVLFVCGLAHWARIRRLLTEADDTGGAEAEFHESPVAPLSRAIVHPAIACAFMDASPAVAAAYERARVPAGSGTPCSPLTLARIEALQSALVRDVYAERFRGGPLDKAGIADFAASKGFEHLLVNGALLRQHRVPTARDMMTAAEVATSTAFQADVARVLLRYPFASARDPRFRGLPRLMPSGRPDDGAPAMALFYADGRRGPGCPMPDGAIASIAIEREALDQWPAPPDAGAVLEPGVILNWPPIDRLVDALCVQALELGRRHATPVRSEPFSGSLEDGIDIRATIRSHARGDETTFVRATPYRQRRTQRTERAWEPVVFIHGLDAQPGDCLRALAEPLAELLPFARDPQRMRDIESRRSVVVEQIGFGSMRSLGGARRTPGGLGTYCWLAVAVFSPCHFTWKGTARFLEESEYRANPLASYPMPTSTRGQVLTPAHPVVRLFADEHGMHLDLEDWAGSMIRMAMAYARTAVTVVAPDAYAVAPAIRAEAASRGVALRQLPRSLFAADTLAAAARWYAVQPLAGTDCRLFPENVEREFGQRADAHAELLPGWMKAYESGGSPS